MNLCIDCVSFQEKDKKPFFSCSNKKSESFGAFLPNRLTWKICNLYERITVRPKGLRLIEDFRGRKEFKDSTFWIIGAGPNLDFYQPPYCSDDFFKDKFTITVNLVWRVFPESTFHLGEWWQEEESMRSDPSCNLEKSILSLRDRELLPSASYSTSFQPLKGRDLQAIYMRTGWNLPADSKFSYELMARQIFGDGDCLFQNVGTTAHRAIFAAAVLGARRIILVGCSYKLPKLPAIKVHAHRKGLEGYVERDKNLFRVLKKRMENWRRQLVQITETFRRYGVEIIRHRYEEEKKKFVFEEIK